MAAHKFWRLRVLRDSGYYSSSDGSYYLDLTSLHFFDKSGARLQPNYAHSSGHSGDNSAYEATKPVPSSYLRLLTNILREKGYAWVVGQWTSPVDVAYIGIDPANTNCPLDFAIDYSDDGMIWKQSARHTMARVSTFSYFPTGSKVDNSTLLGEYPLWRVRMLVDTGTILAGRHVMQFGQLRFIDGLGNAVTPVAAISSGYSETETGTPTLALGSGQVAIFTDGLYDGSEGDCYIGMMASSAFRPTKVRFIQQGTGAVASNATFVIEGSTNGKTWFEESRFTNQLISVGTLMDFNISGNINNIMTYKKLSELPYSELTAAQAKDALVPLSGVGDEADTMYRVSLADLAAMIVNSENVGTDYHKEHRGWRIAYRSTSGAGGNGGIGDIQFLNRAGHIIPLTGTPYAYNGHSDHPASNAFDGNPATQASSQDIIGDTFSGAYAVGYIFDDAVDVGSFKITPTVSHVGDAPRDFAIQYSDDGGISWTSFSAYEGVTDWSAGVSKQFHLPSAGISTSGINYGKDFWRSLDFGFASTMFNGLVVFPCEQKISGAARGRRLIIEGTIRRSEADAGGIIVGAADGSRGYSLSYDADNSIVLAYIQSAASRTVLATLPANSSHNFTGFNHFKLEINIADTAVESNAVSAFVNGIPLPFVSHAAVNMAQDLKVYSLVDELENIQWVHYRWDDNSIDIPVIGEGSGSGSGTIHVTGASPSRTYRIGGFAMEPASSETFAYHVATEEFTFGDAFLGSKISVIDWPTSDYVMTVYRNFGQVIGTITIHSGETHTMETTEESTPITVGDVITIIGQAGDTFGIGGVSVTLLGDSATAPRYMGAVAKLIADAPITNGTTLPVSRIISWQATEHDVGGFWHAAAPDRFIIPAGVTRVRMTAAVSLGNSDANSTLWVGVQKNTADTSTTVDDVPYVAIEKQTSKDYANASATIVTGVIDVQEGDFFTIRITTSDTTTNVRKMVSNFSIEAVDGPALFQPEPYYLRPAPQYVEPTYRFGFFFEHPPASGERIGIHVVSDNFHFVGPFNGAVGSVEVNPATPYVLSVMKNNVKIGEVTVGTTGVVTFSAISPTVTEFAVGDRISLVAPVTADLVISGGAFTFKGVF